MLTATLGDTDRIGPESIQAFINPGESYVTPIIPSQRDEITTFDDGVSDRYDKQRVGSLVFILYSHLKSVHFSAWGRCLLVTSLV